MWFPRRVLYEWTSMKKTANSSNSPNATHPSQVVLGDGPAQARLLAATLLPDDDDHAALNLNQQETIPVCYECPVQRLKLSNAVVFRSGPALPSPSSDSGEWPVMFTKDGSHSFDDESRQTWPFHLPGVLGDTLPRMKTFSLPRDRTVARPIR